MSKMGFVDSVKRHGDDWRMRYFAELNLAKDERAYAVFMSDWSAARGNYDFEFMLSGMLSGKCAYQGW